MHADRQTNRQTDRHANRRTHHNTSKSYREKQQSSLLTFIQTSELRYCLLEGRVIGRAVDNSPMTIATIGIAIGLNIEFIVRADDSLVVVGNKICDYQVNIKFTTHTAGSRGVGIKNLWLTVKIEFITHFDSRIREICG